MNVERALISKLISTGQLQEAISKGVDAGHFADEKCREMFVYLRDHSRRYKSPPSEEAVRDAHPEWDYEYVQDPLNFLIDRFTTLVKRRFAQDMAIELAQAADDPERGDRIEMEFLEVARRLAMMVPSTEVALFAGDAPGRIEEYKRQAAEGKKLGIPFGFPSLDRATQGIQPHEFVTVSAFSGLGKSTFLIVVAFNAWVQGYRPMFISLEMEHHTIMRKFDAMANALDYAKIKQLDLAPEEIQAWEQTAERIREKAERKGAEITVIDSIRGCTPDHVYAETVRHSPDIVFVDYISLMRSSRPTTRGHSMWQSLTEITQDLKQNARTLRVPIVAAAQTNRSGAKDGSELDNIGYSLSIVQDSDIIIGLSGTDENGVDLAERRELEIRLNKNRDGEKLRFPAIWDHRTMNFREKTLKDIYGRPGA